MDEHLRILKRLSLYDPESKERYIAALERALGGAKEPVKSSIGDTLLEIQRLSKEFEKIIMEQGLLYEGDVHPTYGVSGSNDCYFLHERTGGDCDGNRRAYGVAIAPGTREVAAAIVEYYGIHGFKTWSVDPIIYLNHDSNIYTWEVDF